MAKRPGLGSLILAGAAAYGLYKVSKMSPQERNDLVNKGKKLVSDNLGSLKNTLGRHGSTPEARETTFANDVTYGG